MQDDLLCPCLVFPQPGAFVQEGEKQTGQNLLKTNAALSMY